MTEWPAIPSYVSAPPPNPVGSAARGQRTATLPINRRPCPRTARALALVADGLLEVFDAQDRELGLAGARQVLAAHHDRPLAEIAGQLLAGARAHGPQLDDQTLLLIRRLNA